MSKPTQTAGGQTPLQNKEAIRRLLSDPETKKVLSKLQQKDPAKLQAAAQAALKGNAASLGGLVEELVRDPETGQAMEHLDRTMTQR